MLTFSAVGRFQDHWQPLADRLASLLERKQVQIINHTFAHPGDMRGWSEWDIQDDLEKNEEWIHKTFGTTSRPYFRPPSGHHSKDLQAAAARAGFTRTVGWQTSFGDASGITRAHYIQAAQKAIRGGAICVGHANFRDAIDVYPEVVELIKQRRLTSVTIDQLFA